MENVSGMTENDLAIASPYSYFYTVANAMMGCNKGRHLIK